MKKIIFFLSLLVGLSGYGQVVLTTNNTQTVTNKTIYGTQNTIDSIYAANILNLVDTITAHAGGGSSLFPVTGTGTATGAVIADLSGYTLSIISSTVGGTPNLLINPGSYVTLRSLAPEGLSSLLDLANDGDGSRFELYSDNGSTQVDIYGDADAQTIKMTAANGVVFSAPASTTAAILANGTISFYLDEVGNNLKVAVQYSDGTTKTATIALL